MASNELNKMVFEVLDNQLAAGDPPEVRATLDRLVAEGHSEQEARRLLAVVVTSEIWGVINEKRPFNNAGYVRRLHALPDLLED